MNTGLIAIFIILVVIIGAIKTRRCIEFIIIGSILSSLVVYKESFLIEWVNVFLDVLYDEDSVWLVLVCGFFGSLIALLQASKGTFGFTGLITKFCTNERKTLLTSYIMGLLIFVDDYLNILSIGLCMKKVYDKNKIPRETLAYMIDSTGAPICTLLPFSTWSAFFAALFFAEQSVVDLGYSSAIEAYIHSIPYTFYPIFLLIIVFLFTMGWFPKLGAMKKAYERVEKTGKVYSDFSRKFNHDDADFEETGNLWDFMLPMIILVGITVFTEDILFAVVITLFVCLFMYVPRKIIATDNFITLIIEGFTDMLPTVSLVLMGYVLEVFMGDLGMTEYVIEIVTPILNSEVLPAIVFVLVSALTFTTGSNWGMSAISIPIVIPLAAAVDANIILTMAAITSGGAFGSHACFYSDATMLTSTSSGIDNIEHAATQLPYVLIATGLSVIAFLICGFTM